MSAMFNSVFAQQMAELFEPGLRATAMAFSYNMSAMVFGAFSLVFVTWLTATTGSALVPGYYVAGVALLCLATNLIFRKLRHRLAE
jgi:MHS family proline/betaine transporter-like MFS transporter